MTPELLDVHYCILNYGLSPGARRNPPWVLYEEHRYC